MNGVNGVGHGANGLSLAPSTSTPSRSQRRQLQPVYEVVADQPNWCRLKTLCLERVASLTMRAVVRAVKTHGRVLCLPALKPLRDHVLELLPAELVNELLQLCLSNDHFQCHHNPTDCIALELWRLLYNKNLDDQVNIVHHEFAFHKSCNYPDIMHNLDALLQLMTTEPAAAVKSFKLELKHSCEMNVLLENRLAGCMAKFGCRLHTLELPGMFNDQLLNVIALYCTNLEVLNMKGSREEVTDCGFFSFVEQAKCRDKLRQLDVTRCGLTQQSLLSLRKLTTLQMLKMSTTLLYDISYACDGQAVMLQVDTDSGDHADPVGLIGDQLALPSVTQVTVESDNQIRVTINQAMTYLRHVFPRANNIQLTNCVACELHVTLTQHPTNLTFMRETIQTLELISADYFSFPRLVYPCPNLESLAIEKPSNEVFNFDQQNGAFLYGNTIPFINLKHLKLSQICLTNLTHFLSKSRNLKKFKVTNIGRRERPRWTDQRIQQILPADSVPFLEYFHVSCLPHEGYSTSDTHRYLHLTKATVRYLTENFKHLEKIYGIESWSPTDCNKTSLLNMLHKGGGRDGGEKTFAVKAI